MMVKDIGIRIKKLRKDNKYSQQFIAAKLNISQSAYSLIESAHNNVMINHVLTLSELYNVSTDYILRGEDKLIKLDVDNGFIPFINVEAVAGRLDDLHFVHETSDFNWYRIPGFKANKNHLLFEVEGDSMSPTLSQNDVVLCEAQDNIDTIATGSIVIVGTEDGLIVKRFSRDQEYCVLESDNKKYSPIKIHRGKIQAIMAVKGKITKTFNSATDFDDSKLETMENNLRNLESKLERISQQFS